MYYRWVSEAELASLLINGRISGRHGHQAGNQIAEGTRACCFLQGPIMAQYWIMDTDEAHIAEIGIMDTPKFLSGIISSDAVLLELDIPIECTRGCGTYASIFTFGFEDQMIVEEWYADYYLLEWVKRASIAGATIPLSMSAIDWSRVGGADTDGGFKGKLRSWWED